MKENTLRILYNVITDQTISSNGRFLYACSNYGDIAIYNIEKITNCVQNITSENISDPIFVFKNQFDDQKPLSLAFHRDFLIVGNTNSSVFGYEVNNSTGIIGNLSWKIQLAPEISEDVNDLWIDTENETLYAACGNDVFQISLEDGRIIHKFEGHKDYIHSVNGFGNNFVTGSEDGTVKLWDHRQKKATNSLEPSKNPNLVQKTDGKLSLSWIGSACITKEWMAFGGGGTKLALFHITQLNYRTPFHIFEEFTSPIHVTEFVDDNILCAGESKSVMQFSLKGNMVSEIETSGPAIYSVVWQKQPNKFLSLSGASNKIDVSTNFTYKDTALNFYKKDKN